MPDQLTEPPPDVPPPHFGLSLAAPSSLEEPTSSTTRHCCLHPKPWMKAAGFELLTMALSMVVLSFSAISALPAWVQDVIEWELFLFIIFFFASILALSCLTPKLAFLPRYQMLQYVRAGILGCTTVMVLVLDTTSLSVLFLCLVSVYIPAAIFFAIWIKSTHNRLHQSTTVRRQEAAREVAKPPPSYSDVDATPPSYTDYLRMYARKISNHVAPSDAPIRQIFNTSETFASSTGEETCLDYSNIPGTSDMKVVTETPDTKIRSPVGEPVKLAVVIAQKPTCVPPFLVTKLTAIPEDQD